MRTPNDTVADREFLISDPMMTIPAGAWDGVTSVNKFGVATSGIQATTTDIWDRADATPTQQIWVKPTAARVHQVKSTSVNDDLLGTGAWTLRLYGLREWNEKESFEDIVLDGTNNVATASEYVIIHRMRITTWGAGATNAGTITATADTDATVTAQINIGWGQTEMAIYGIPTTQTAYLVNWYASMNKASGTSADATFSLVWNSAPNLTNDGYIVKEVRGLQSTGTCSQTFTKSPYKKFEGAGILKVQAIASAADVDGAAGFDLILVDN